MARPWLITALISVASIVYLAMYLTFLEMDRGLHTWVQAAGAVGWTLAAMLLQTGRPVTDAVPALAAFLILTVAGERLELARMAMLTPARRSSFLVAAGLFGAGVVAATWLPDAGRRLGGIGLLALAAWLARYDIARRTVRIPGVTRFIALCLLAGYALAGRRRSDLARLRRERARPRQRRDAPRPVPRLRHLHGLRSRTRDPAGGAADPAAVPAVVLRPPRAACRSASWCSVVAGDILGHPEAWQVGGVLTVASMLVFVVASAASAVSATLSMRHSRAGLRRDRYRPLPFAG